jgi:RNA-binding motif protein, X-linked 2
MPKLNVQQLNELELKQNSKTSWHEDYSDSAYIYIGNTPADITEGDLIAIFSQYGEVMDVLLVKEKAFAFLGYENQKSTILAIDNLNGITVGGSTIRVDHSRFKDKNVHEQRKRIKEIYPHFESKLKSIG